MIQHIFLQFSCYVAKDTNKWFPVFNVNIKGSLHSSFVGCPEIYNLSIDKTVLGQGM